MSILKELGKFLDTIDEVLTVVPDLISDEHINKLQRLRNILGLIDQLQRGR